MKLDTLILFRINSVLGTEPLSDFMPRLIDLWPMWLGLGPSAYPEEKVLTVRLSLPWGLHSSG